MAFRLKGRRSIASELGGVVRQEFRAALDELERTTILRSPARFGDARTTALVLGCITKYQGWRTSANGSGG